MPNNIQGPNNRSNIDDDGAEAPLKIVRDCTLDWVKIDTTVMRDPALSPPAKALYGILSTFADRDTRVSDEDPTGFDVPTRKRLAFCLGKSVDTVDRVTAELEAYRLDGRPLLIVERRSDPQNPKANLPSVYHLLDHEHWDARAAERHAARGGRKSAARGGRTDAARGGRTDAARGGRKSAAVPFTSQKTTTHRVREDANAEASAAVSGVGSGGVPQADLDALRAIVRPEVYDMLTLDERGELGGAIRCLLGAGWTTDAIRARKVDRRVNTTTTHPATHVRRAIDTLASESVPTQVEDRQIGSSVAAIDADRAERRAARRSPVRDEAARLAVAQGADPAAAAEWAQSSPLPTIERWVKNRMSVPSHLVPTRDGDGGGSLSDLARSLGDAA